MKTILKTLCIALLFASCSKEEIEQPINVVTYHYELGFLQKFRNHQSTSNEPTTSETFDSGEGTKVEGDLTNIGGNYHFALTGIPTAPSEATFYITITDSNGNIVKDELYACGTHTAWALDYNVTTNILISTPQ
ncbi:hypothetical protein [Flavobacterium sp.]|uniref:hypothetical protein n=1 Tax=Flavobacterium sp. TaxID=239 RepID=UPI002621B8FB|nr:hypothetical protein [Flavobacterium sp.]